MEDTFNALMDLRAFDDNGHLGTSVAYRHEALKKYVEELVSRAKAAELQVEDLKGAANDLLNGLRIAARDLAKVNQAAAQDALDCLKTNEERAKRFSEKQL